MSGRGWGLQDSSLSLRTDHPLSHSNGTGPSTSVILPGAGLPPPPRSSCYLLAKSERLCVLAPSQVFASLAAVSVQAWRKQQQQQQRQTPYVKFKSALSSRGVSVIFTKSFFCLPAPSGWLGRKPFCSHIPVSYKWNLSFTSSSLFFSFRFFREV